MLDFVKPPVDLPESHTINPYWDKVRLIPGDDFEWNYYHVWAPACVALLFNGDGSLKPPEQRIDRHKLCSEYTFAIPDPDSLNFVAQWLKPAAIEMGAGTGYWVWQLSQLGVDSIAYDIDPPDDGYNFYHNRENKQDIKVYHPIMRGTPEMLANHPDRTLFLCWPPMSDMAVKSLEHYQGKRLVYIGEGDGGCTADDAFFAKLSQGWVEVAERRPIQWDGIHDMITVYERQEGARDAS